MTMPTNEQVRSAAEEAVHGAIGVMQGECLAQIKDEHGNYISEVGFRLKNKKQNGEFELVVYDEETDQETTIRFRVKVEMIED